MYLDFAQVLTQIFAFIIVFIVLRAYGWRPLLKIMEDRKQLIQSQFDQISEERKEVEQLKNTYHLKLATIDHEGRLQIQEAIKQEHQMAYEIQEESKEQAKAIIKKAKEEADRHVLEAKNTLKNEIITISFALSEKILEQELDPQKHQKLINDFVNQVEFK